MASLEQRRIGLKLDLARLWESPGILEVRRGSTCAVETGPPGKPKEATAACTLDTKSALLMAICPWGLVIRDKQDVGNGHGGAVDLSMVAQSVQDRVLGIRDRAFKSTALQEQPAHCPFLAERAHPRTMFAAGAYLNAGNRAKVG